MDDMLLLCDSMGIDAEKELKKSSKIIEEKIEKMRKNI